MKKKFICLIIAAVLVTPLMGNIFPREISTASTLDPQARDVYYLRNAKSGKYLDLQASSAATHTDLQQYPFGTSGYASERFEITADTGYFVVRAGNLTTRVMDGGGCTNGSQVVLGSYSSSDYAQKWHFKRNDDDGTYCIMSADDPDLNLAVQNGSAASNAKVVLENGSYTTSSGVRIYADRQKWYLEPIDAENFGFQYMFEDEDEFSWISSGYKLSDRPGHYGIDIVGRTQAIHNIPIISPCSGTIVYCGEDDDFGFFIKIQTDTCWPGTGQNLLVSFLHMINFEEQETPSWDVGDRVCVGDLLGYVGNTGDSCGSHLHYEIYKPPNDVVNSDDHYYIRSYTSYNPEYFHPYVSFANKISTVWP